MAEKVEHGETLQVTGYHCYIGGGGGGGGMNHGCQHVQTLANRTKPGQSFQLCMYVDKSMHIMKTA
jgi:hypothetical protein